MHLLMTGSNSPTGKIVSKFLSDNGYLVLKTSREKSDSGFYFNLQDDEGVRCRLEQKIEAILHFAYDSQCSIQKNIENTKKIIDWGLKNGIKNQIFISTEIAAESNLTKYSIIKWAIEQYCREKKMCVLRLGMLTDLSSSSFFDLIQKTKKRFTVFPDADYRIPVTTPFDLCTSILNCIREKKTGTFTVQSCDPVTFKEVVDLSKQKWNRGSIQIFLPVRRVLSVISVFSQISSKFRGIQESLKNLENFQKNPNQLENLCIQKKPTECVLFPETKSDE